MSPSKRLAEETSFEKTPDAETVSIDEYGCKSCLWNFLFCPVSHTIGFENGPKFCPSCGRRNAAA